MKHILKNLLFFWLVLLVAPMFAQESEVVVAYLPTYRNWPNSVFTTDLDIVTHINVAFENPDQYGNINMPNGIQTVVNEAHLNEVKVLISIAGAGADANTYGQVLGNATTRDAFVNNLVQACLSYDLDGVDIDIEGDVLNGNNVTASMYEDFVVALRSALHAQSKLMTAALGTWFLNQVTNTAAAQFDFINIMSYDAHGTWTGPGQHSSFQLAVNGFNDWRNKGVPANKLVVGVPFYGYGWGSYGTRAWTFNEIVNQFPGSENQDQVGSGNDVIYYNGIPTIKEKATWAFENALGVMYWEETQDASGDLSLLNAIGEVKGVSGTNTAPRNLLTGKPVTASSTEENHTPENVNDRRYDTRWSSEYTDPQWIAIDLEGNYHLDSIKIYWETALASNYEIQVSDDGTNWVTIQSIMGNSLLINEFTDLDAPASHLRIYGIERATAYGFSIYEIEAYGRAISSPYYGAPLVVPGIIQAEDYDLGGQNVAYYDAQGGNEFGDYRSEDVDIQPANDESGMYNIGAFDAGEWLNYTIEVDNTATYEIKARVASEQSNTAFHLELDGQNVTGTVAVPNTGGWQNWQSLTVATIELSRGEHVLRLVSDQSYFNVNYFEIAPSTVTRNNHYTTEMSNQVYPNPSPNGRFSIEGFEKVSVFSIQGIFIREEQIVDGVLDLSDLHKGMYVLESKLGQSRIFIH